jgi:hypothetical protein
MNAVYPFQKSPRCSSHRQRKAFDFSCVRLNPWERWVPMTENTTFFGAQRGAGPPDTRPQAAEALWACQNARPGQIRDGTGGYLGNAGLTGILLLLLKIVRDAAEGNEATLSVRNVCNLPCATWSMNVDWAAALVE